MIPLADIPGAGTFKVILADPPWRFKTWSAKGRDRCPDAPVKRWEQRKATPERHYATMTLEDIKALPVGQVAAKDCVLILWAIDPMLPQALDVGAAWGFKYKTICFDWAKTRKAGSPRHLLHGEAANKLFPMGPGYWTRSNPERCLLFTRGKPKRISAAVRQLIIAPRREHSRKPDEQYPGIEALCEGPYLELFARARRPGWEAWGDQIGKFEPLFEAAA